MSNRIQNLTEEDLAGTKYFFSLKNTLVFIICVNVDEASFTSFILHKKLVLGRAVLLYYTYSSIN